MTTAAENSRFGMGSSPYLLMVKMPGGRVTVEDSVASSRRITGRALRDAFFADMRVLTLGLLRPREDCADERRAADRRRPGCQSTRRKPSPRGGQGFIEGEGRGLPALAADADLRRHAAPPPPPD